ncbi:unnamed protein product [Clonostachys rosea]|uniref:N-acetyltransferase domain-containing protein n=1 Tax=Bionectria ochroleuca TaxID=29856 RepID=A0ABY6U5K6_BIOOC|nr:unnamed protein product [Clonostachys rosea]
MANQRASEKVDLIPWDPADEAHYQRMYSQRSACGWREDEVALWKEEVLAGHVFFYWITLLDHEVPQESLAKMMITEQEKEPLKDTVGMIGKEPRRPSGRSFVPIGHISLRHISDLNTQFSLPQDTIWIKSLYVSWALQAGGFGRSAMAQLERLAAAPPYNASVVALDTIRRDYHLSEEHLCWLYDRRGLERPKRHVSTQDWYTSQGYEQIPNSAVSFYENKDEDGSVQRLPVVFLSKELPATA